VFCNIKILDCSKVWGW